MNKIVFFLFCVLVHVVPFRANCQSQTIKLTQLQAGKVGSSFAKGLVGITRASDGKQVYQTYVNVSDNCISFRPLPTLNLTNLNEFVIKCGTDSIWYIDFEGRSMFFGTQASGGGGSVADRDWLNISDNGVPLAIQNPIYTDNYAAINMKLVWPAAQLLVGDSSTVGNIVTAGNRESRIGFYRILDNSWASVGKEGASLTARLGTGTTAFDVQAAAGASPSQPGAPFRNIFRVGVDSSIQLVDFKSTRNDTATIRNLLYTDAQGFVKSSPVGELPLPATPSLYNASGVLKDSLEAIGSNNRAFVARNPQYKLINGSNFTGFALGKNTGIRIRSGISDTDNEIFAQIFDGSYSISQRFNRDFNEFQLLRGNVNNTVRYSDTENRYSIYDFSNDFYSEILQQVGNTTITSSGGNVSTLNLLSDTLIGKSSSIVYRDKLGQNQFNIDCIKGFAFYSRNVQDSILANDRRILDLGSLKRYLVLNPPSGGGSARSWNRDGNTGTGTDTLGTTGNFPINFYTNSSKKMELTTLGYAQYSQNLQDSILANDRRILDLGSLKRYLVLNPPSGSGSARSWNRDGNTGTGTDTLGTTGNFPINFYTNAEKRMEITNDGKIALGLNAFGGNQGSIYTNLSATSRSYTGFGTGHWINSSALPAIVLDNNTAPTGKQVFTIQAQTTGRTTFEYRNNNGTGSPAGAANMLVLNPSNVGSTKPSIGLNVANPTNTLDVDGTVAFRGVSITQAAAGNISASTSVDVSSTLNITYNGVADGILTLQTPSAIAAKYLTVVNVGSTDFIISNTHLRAVNGLRACTFIFNTIALAWEPTMVRPWTSTTALGTNSTVAANTVVDNILTVSLPSAGTYELRGIIQGTIPTWADGDVQVRLGSGASSDANTVGTMKVFSDATNGTMALSFVKRVTVAAATNIILSVNNRQETQTLTVLANSSSTGQGTSIYAQRIN